MTVQTDIANVEAAFAKLKAYVSEEVAEAINGLIVALHIKHANAAAVDASEATPAANAANQQPAGQATAAAALDASETTAAANQQPAGQATAAVV